MKVEMPGVDTGADCVVIRVSGSRPENGGCYKFDNGLGSEAFGASSDVETGGYLYDVKSGDPGEFGKLSHDGEQVAGNKATDHNFGGTGCVAGVDNADVEAEVDGVAVLAGDFQRPADCCLGAFGFHRVGGYYGDAL